MKEDIVARVYAKSFLSLAESENLNIADEITKLTETINISNDLENVLFLDVFSSEEKKDVISKIIDKLSLSNLLKNIIFYLIQEKRISLLPLICKEIIVYDDNKKGFIRGTIEGSLDEIPDKYIVEIKKILKKRMSVEPELSYKKSDKVTSGFKVTVDDMQLDASLDTQLENFKKSIVGDY